MIDYLKDELSFLRNVAWHVLLLCLLCVLVRSTATQSTSSSVGGIPLPINSVLFIIMGPIYALIVQFIVFMESNNLAVQREAFRQEVIKARSKLKFQTWTSTVIIVLPTIACLFFIWQFVTMVAPSTQVNAQVSCQSAAWSAHFFSIYAGPSMHCLRDVTEGNPWIYLPTYDIVLALIGIATVALGYFSIRRWFDIR